MSCHVMSCHVMSCHVMSCHGFVKSLIPTGILTCHNVLVSYYLYNLFFIVETEVGGVDYITKILKYRSMLLVYMNNRVF